MSQTSLKAIVIGAGLAGLSAGYRLQQAGWQVQVLERADYPGGRAASLNKQGYLIDTGATGVGDVYSEYMALIEELGLGEQVEYASPITATLRDGKLYEVNGDRPLLSGLMSGLLSWRSKLILPRLLRDLKAMGDNMHFQDVSIGHEYDNESAASYALRRLNQELLDYFVDPILRALVVARASEVSRLELMNAMNGLFSTRLLGTRGGMALLPNTLAERIGNVRFHCRVNSLQRRQEAVVVNATDVNTGQTFTESADACVLATTVPEAINIDPACKPLLAPLAESLHYIPGICVHLGYRVKTHSKAVMALVSSKDNPDITLIWLDHNKVSDRAPQGHSLLYLYYDDAVAEQAAAKTDAELVAECSAFVEQVFPELRSQQDMQQVSRWPRAVPKPAPGIYKKMHQVRQCQKQASNDRVQLAGDYLSCVGQNTAIVYGELAAKNLIAHYAKPGQEN